MILYKNLFKYQLIKLYNKMKIVIYYKKRLFILKILQIQNHLNNQNIIFTLMFKN